MCMVAIFLKMILNHMPPGLEEDKEALLKKDFQGCFTLMTPCCDEGRKSLHSDYCELPYKQECWRLHLEYFTSWYYRYYESKGKLRGTSSLGNIFWAVYNILLDLAPPFYLPDPGMCLFHPTEVLVEFCQSLKNYTHILFMCIFYYKTFFPHSVLLNNWTWALQKGAADMGQSLDPWKVPPHPANVWLQSIPGQDYVQARLPWLRIQSLQLVLKSVTTTTALI